jgi:carboxymethylenebutenolidase
MGILRSAPTSTNVSARATRTTSPPRCAPTAALPTPGKVGLFGSCSGGRHAFIYACQKKDVDACAELWGGRVVMGKEDLNTKTPVAPIDMTKDLSCPLIGIFGNDDRAPSPEQVNQHEAELTKHGKSHEFHRYDGAGHGIWYWHRPLYRPESAMDGWSKMLAFFGKHLAK